MMRYSSQLPVTYPSGLYQPILIPFSTPSLVSSQMVKQKKAEAHRFLHSVHVSNLVTGYVKIVFTSCYWYWDYNLINCIKCSIICKIWLNHYIRFISVPLCSPTAAILYLQACIKLANWGGGAESAVNTQQGSSKLYIKTHSPMYSIICGLTILFYIYVSVIKSRKKNS